LQFNRTYKDEKHNPLIVLIKNPILDPAVKHQEIRFHILHYLYSKHYAGEPGIYQELDNIINEVGLGDVERHLVIGDVALSRNL